MHVVIVLKNQFELLITTLKGRRTTKILLRGEGLNPKFKKKSILAAC